MKDPFNNQQTKKRYLKIGLYGATGVGKTLFALTFPGLAYIDCEGGTTFYNIVPLRTKSFSETINAVKFLKTEKHNYKTIVIDPVTVIYEALQAGRFVYKTKNLDKAVSGEEYNNFSFKDWGDIKRFYNLLISELLNLPMNVIVIGRMKDEYVMKGKEMIKIGHKFDGEKSTPYHFDIVGELFKRDQNRILRLDKCRPGDWDQGDEIKNPSFETFRHLIDNVTDDNVATVETEEDASRRDAEFFQQQESDDSRNQQQQKPSRQQTKSKQGTIADSNGNGNGKTLSPKAIWTKFDKLGYSPGYKDLYKRYYLNKWESEGFHISSMNELPQDKLVFLDKTLTNAIKDEKYKETFRQHLDGFRQKPTQKTVSGNTKGITMENLYSMLEMTNIPENYKGKWETWVCHRYNLAGPWEMSTDEMIEQKEFIAGATNSEQDCEAFIKLIEPYDESSMGSQYPEHFSTEAPSLN